MYPEATEAFLVLSECPGQIQQDALATIERFVVLLYSKTLDVETVNEARQVLFSKGNRQLENIPPTHDALIEHVKRATYQAGHVWAQALNPEPQLPSPGAWGWKRDGQCWIPRWTTLPEASDACRKLLKCGCQKSCSGRCKCGQANLDCTQLCGCSGQGFCVRQIT